MTTTKTQPTPEQLNALQKFAKANGRTWKSKLHTVWMNGHYRSLPGTEEYWYLQQIRNQFGPTWLMNFKLAEVWIAAVGVPTELVKHTDTNWYWTPKPVLTEGRGKDGHLLAEVLGQAVQYSGHDRVPEIGELVDITCNGIGKSEVVGYFVEFGYAGVLALPQDPPARYREQNLEPSRILGRTAGVFGSEFDLIEEQGR